LRPEPAPKAGLSVAETPAKDATVEPESAEEPLQPTPDPREGPPAPVEAASFNGVTLGVATKEDVAKAWGQPEDASVANGSLVQLYSLKPFKQVEVSYTDGKVSSIVVRFDRSFPAAAVAKQLDLSSIRPVLVSNDVGEVLGLAYPERGVLFAFDPSTEPGKASMQVPQIILEPISSEPFVLRAETTLKTRCDLSRRDLEQALALEPGNARAHWLLSRVLGATEQREKAVVAATEAVRLAPDDAQYRVTRAQLLARTGHLPEALREAKKAAETSENRPHVGARAVCLVGDLVASGPKPDFKKALDLHTQAIQLAGPLASNPHPAIRVAAKEVLIDAHLGAAHDIAWGEWKQKSKAVARWLERAATVADDLVKNEGGSREQLFRVHVRTLAAYVGVRGEIDPEPAVKALVETGEELIADAYAPGRKAQLQWELGMAMYDAVQICQMRSDSDSALKYGEAAVAYLSAVGEASTSRNSTLLLGRLYFRLGAIHSLNNRDHKAAVAWFDKAVPLLERPASKDAIANLGRHGESFVSMGVSYWETNQREKAVELTQKGIKWMEQAARQGTLDRSGLAVPYSNLAAMHRKLGAADLADRFQELASRITDEKLK